MHRILLANLLAIIFINVSFAQQQRYLRDSADLQNVKQLQIKLDPTYNNASSLFPFSAIQVKDVRFDTTHIGLYSQFSNVFVPSIKNIKINLQDGVSKSMADHFKVHFKQNLSSGKNEIVCFIKKLKIVKRDTVSDEAMASKTFGQLNFQAAVFMKTENGCHAAFKIDTLLIESIGISSKKEVSDEVKESLITPALNILKNKINTTDWRQVMTRKTFSESAVYENYYHNRFNLPILSQSYKKGVFRTFSEFINNNPSTQEFEIKNEKYNTFSLVDKNGDYINTLKIFGFSDGKRCWIQRTNNSFPLIRTGNSFEFFWTIYQNLKILVSFDLDEKNIL